MNTPAPIILAIDTSADETSAAVTQGRRVLSKVVYSQILLYKDWGGIVPSIAKRAHEERIDWVIEEVLRKYNICARLHTPDHKQLLTSHIDAIAVTRGPGLAIALGVGINTAKELASEYGKKLIGINHMEGHLYSSFVQNSAGNPKRELRFPMLGFLISGGHTMLVQWRDHLTYEVLGETLDDAAGEAIDKAAKMLELGYPGGPVIEQLARRAGNVDQYHFTRPMLHSGNLNFSFSGLKTAFLYRLRDIDDAQVPDQMQYLASSFQEAVFDTLAHKLECAMQQTHIHRIALGGGVVANTRLRSRIRSLARKYDGEVFAPPYPYLYGDNAAMIGVVAHYYAQQNKYCHDMNTLDRVARLAL